MRRSVGPAMNASCSYSTSYCSWHPRQVPTSLNNVKGSRSTLPCLTHSFKLQARFIFSLQSLQRFMIYTTHFTALPVHSWHCPCIHGRAEGFTTALLARVASKSEKTVAVLQGSSGLAMNGSACFIVGNPGRVATVFYGKIPSDSGKR